MRTRLENGFSTVRPLAAPAILVTAALIGTAILAVLFYGPAKEVARQRTLLRQMEHAEALINKEEYAQALALLRRLQQANPHHPLIASRINWVETMIDYGAPVSPNAAGTAASAAR